MFFVLALIVVLGVVLYLVETYVPMAPPFKIVLRVIVVLIIVYYLLALVNLIPGPVVPLRRP